MDINLVIAGKGWTQDMEDALFGLGCPGYVRPNRIQPTTALDFLDVLVTAGVFKSKGQARKAGHMSAFAWGFTDVFMGKLKTRITIWNPAEEP